MTQLTLTEARDLAEVFGELDRHESIILLLFSKPRNKYSASVLAESLPKSHRISKDSIYRKTDHLCELSFLEVAKIEKFIRGSLREEVKYYQPTLKGILAAYIQAYVFALDSKTPTSLKEKVDLENYLRILDSSPVSGLFFDFLRWHRKRGDDLGRVNIDMIDLVLGFLHFALDQSESMSERVLLQARDKMREFGLSAPDVDPKEIRRLLISGSSTLKQLEERLLTSIRQEQQATGGDSKV